MPGDDVDGRRACTFVGHVQHLHLRDVAEQLGREVRDGAGIGLPEAEPVAAACMDADGLSRAGAILDHHGLAQTPPSEVYASRRMASLPPMKCSTIGEVLREDRPGPSALRKKSTL